MDEEFLDRLFQYIRNDEYNTFAYHITEHIFKTNELRERRDNHIMHFPNVLAKTTENRYKAFGIPTREHFSVEMQNLVSRQRKIFLNTSDQDMTYSSEEES